MKFLFFLHFFFFSLAAQEEAPQEIPKEPLQTHLIQGSNRFAISLYSQLKKRSDSFAFSPYTISQAFAIPYTGAREGTQSQIANTLFYPEDSAAEIDRSFHELNHMLTNAEIPSDFMVKMASALWIQKGLSVDPEFLKIINQNYRSAIKAADFNRYPETMRDLINSWVRETTQSKITDLIQPREITPSTRMLLASAIYLKARWSQPFNAAVTRFEPYFPDDQRTITLPTMIKVGNYRYFKDTDVAVVELPYEKGGGSVQLGFWIVLPNDSNGLATLENSLTHERFLSWSSNLKNQKIELYLPKFKILESLSLDDMLSKMGMFVPFSENANFSGISQAQPPLRLSNAVHKCFMSIDESGTEVTALTGQAGLATVVGGEEPVVFKVNHPFLFFIVENHTNLILYIGRFVSQLKI